MARKLTATAPDGTIITRRTDRTYTHVVVCQTDPAKRLDGWLRNAELSHRKCNFDFMCQEAGPDAKYGTYRSEKELAEYKRVAAMGHEAWRNEAIARVHKEHADWVAAGGPSKWLLCGWCGRPDLAQKLAAKDHGDGCNVTIIPVNP